MLKLKRNKKLMIPILALVLVVAMAGSALADTRTFTETFYNYELVDGIFRLNDTHFALFADEISCSGVSDPWIKYRLSKTNDHDTGHVEYLISGNWLMSDFGTNIGCCLVYSGDYTGWVRARLEDYEGYTNAITVVGRWESGSSSSVGNDDDLILYPS